MIMVNLEVYNAYANQHKHTLMQSAQVSRDLKHKNDVSRSMNHTSPVIFAWLGKHSEHISGKIKVCNADVLLLDWNLPGLIREEFIPSLKDDYPTLAIILMSGRPELKKQACSVGADAFVSKTEPPDKLLATITRISTKSG
jgi:CheY-like chemotaxis protein